MCQDGVCNEGRCSSMAIGLKTTGQQTRITTNGFRAVLSRLARSMADLVSLNGRFRAVFRTRFGAVFKTIVLKTHDDRWFVH